ncbi:MULTISPECIES: pilus assembly protein PilP [Acidithiobacillus]|jgi:type IV pilus assembly protein PilP|uniref:pilus assembly protein PilP n=1 Tax=Acidithiobacillus TaxID=119977 RepID=UPI0009D92B84|nr:MULTISPECIES: pilus assembly protein PilP [Acidithiobacillus]MDD2748993.1 pilus assembly protein PilP [Acidithiobacillus sp.]MDD5280190.1 pilus assembly protein PilP [Acidithiobacillus sp.]
MDKRGTAAYVWIPTALVWASVCLLSGCSQQTETMQSLHQFVQHVPKTTVSIPPLPKTPLWKPLAYQNPAHLDPFTSFSESLLRAEAEQQGVHPAPVQHGPVQPLEKYPLSSLHLIGMVQPLGRVRTTQGHLWAILQTPKHRVYRATLGSAVGTHDGRITAMHHQNGHSTITVTQYVRNIFGKYQRRVTVLHMQDGG